MSLLTDQRGTGFDRVFGAAADIGAFEVQLTGVVCPLPQGYWKDNPDAWPVDSLTLGSETYTSAELLNLLNTPTGTGRNADASLIPARHLIAAKLNIANGADASSVAGTIDCGGGIVRKLQLLRGRPRRGPLQPKATGQVRYHHTQQ